MNYTTLKTEIETDPAKLGYEPFVASGNDQAIANLLNTAGSGTIAVPNLDRATFLLNISPAYLALPGVSGVVQSKWDRILDSVRASESVDFTSPYAQSLLGAAVQDGILTQAQVASLNQRTGSRAEVLFGPGTIIQQSDVSMALRNKQ